MAADRNERMVDVYPFLCYRDAARAIDWLVEAFGFRKGMVTAGPDGSIVHAELSLGRGVVMVGTMVDDALGMRTPAELGAVTQGTYVGVPDPDSHYARAMASGAEIVYPIRDTTYGSREYAARDPEGHLWSFGSYVPEVVVEAEQSVVG